MLYRSSQGEGVYKFVQKEAGVIYEKYAPYSYKTMRNKVKDLGLEYTPRQYAMQVIGFAAVSGVCSYLYFYNIIVTLIYNPR